MKRIVTERLLKRYDENELIMEKLGIETEEELKQANPIKVWWAFFRLTFGAIGTAEEEFQRIEKYEERIKNNDPTLTEFSVTQQAKLYNEFLEENYLKTFYEFQEKFGDNQINYKKLQKEKRREDLEKYFTNVGSEYVSPVFVFEGEEGELRLLQRWYAINYANEKHLFWRKLVIYEAECNPLRLDILRGEASIWGMKEWVQKQVDKVEDDEVKKMLKSYKYSTFLDVFFPQSGKLFIIGKDKGQETNVFENIKLD